MAKVTGIGGVFFKSKSDPKAIADWYRNVLGLELEDFGGSILRWPEDKASDQGITVWHVAGPDSQWFAPSTAGFMINYRIDDMDGMIERLRRHGVEPIQGPETHENGRFLWIVDPDGVKVELWEPKAWDPNFKKS